MFPFLQKVVSTIQDELCPVSDRYKMLFQAVKLLWIVAAVSYRTNARCALHRLEDIGQESVSSNVEKINFNQIITSLLELITTTEHSKISRITGNFIIGEGKI